MKRAVSESMWAVVVTTMLLAVGGVALAATTTTASGIPEDGTVQTDGRVSAIVVAGGKVYLGGYFTHVNGVERNHLASIDAVTGQLTDWNPNVNGSVRALAVSSEGTSIYAGGEFTSVGGTSRRRLAALDAGSGAVEPFRAGANATVEALAVSGSNLFVGGHFTTVNGQSRAHVAKVDSATGDLNSKWVAANNGAVWALRLSADGSRLYTGGDFTTVNGKPRSYLAALRPGSGALDTTWQPATTPNGRVFAFATDASRVYTAEGGPGGAVEAYSTSTGTRAWRVKGDGDAQTVTLMADKVYAGGHFDALGGQSRNKFAALDAATGALDPNWTPSATGGNCSSQWVPDPCIAFVWALAADPLANQLYAGGDFRKVSGVAHAGFARFS